MPKQKGLFITFEGPDGSGKSSVLEFLKKEVAKKYDSDLFLFTREPGGTPVGEKIREILLTNGNDMLPITEAFLFAASRAELFQGPGLKHYESGKVLVSDRYVDSSLVYQGIGRGIGLETVKKINSYAIKKLMPDYTFFLMINPEQAKSRIHKYRNKVDRLDVLDNNINQKIYKEYQQIIKKNKNRAIEIDASQNLDIVCERVFKHFKKIVDKHIKE